MANWRFFHPTIEVVARMTIHPALSRIPGLLTRGLDMSDVSTEIPQYTKWMVVEGLSYGHRGILLPWASWREHIAPPLTL
ncbi:MAG: hypothetical protein ACOX6S_01730 [Clostridia bacterium]